MDGSISACIVLALLLSPTASSPSIASAGGFLRDTEQVRQYSFAEVRESLAQLFEVSSPEFIDPILVLYQVADNGWVELLPLVRRIVEEFERRGDPEDFYCGEAMLALYQLGEDEVYFRSWAERFRESPRVAGFGMMLWSVRSTEEAMAFVERAWPEATDDFWRQCTYEVVHLDAAKDAYAKAKASERAGELLKLAIAGFREYCGGGGDPHGLLRGTEPFAIWAREQILVLARTDPRLVADAFDAFDYRKLGSPSEVGAGNPRDELDRDDMTRMMKAYLVQFLPENVKALIDWPPARSTLRPPDHSSGSVPPSSR